MATNIKITYTTDLEEIPSEVSQILASALDKLEEATGELFTTATDLEQNDVSIPEKLTEIKKFLEIGIKTLNRVDEMYAILSQFHQLKTTPPEQPKQETPKVKEEKEPFTDS